LVTQTLARKKSGTNFNWSPEEDEIVRLHYKGVVESVRQISQTIYTKFGITRSHDSIVHRASTLLLTKNICTKWTTEEEEKLANMAGKYSTSYICKILGRSVGSIQRKCHDLNLSRDTRQRDGWYILSDLPHIFGVSFKTIYRWIDEGKLKGTQYDGRTLKFSRKNLKAFYCRWTLELSGRNVDLLQIREILCPDYKMDY